jgi:hypothetical protein
MLTRMNGIMAGKRFLMIYPPDFLTVATTAEWMNGIWTERFCLSAGRIPEFAVYEDRPLRTQGSQRTRPIGRC